MNGPTQGRPLAALFWRLYIVLGLASLGGGAFLMGAPHLVFSSARAELMPVRIVGIILIVFGIVRIVNAVVQLRRMRRR